MSEEMQQYAAQLKQVDPDLHVPGVGVSSTGVTVFLYGTMGTWKTSWAGQWPSPVFLSIGTEGGDDSLALLPQLTGKPTPPVYQVNSVRMIDQKIDFILNNYERMGWKTVVVDSITFLSDMWIRELFAERMKNTSDPSKIAMHMRDWGFLEAFICKTLAQRLHNTRLNVIWIALEKPVYETDNKGEQSLIGVKPYIQGAAATKLPALCKMILWAEKKLHVDPNNPMNRVVQPVFHTAATRLAQDVRHKYGLAFQEGCLVDPTHGPYPSFEAVNSRIGGFIFQ